jgi:type IV fimbrial biogenesis protein FimT
VGRWGLAEDHRVRPVVARACRGFTLIELMVTVAVIAILAVVAIPNLRDLVHNNRLRAASNELVASLQAARMEAVRLNTPAQVCRSADGATCIGSNGNWAGWVVLADLDKNGTADIVRTGTFNPSVLIATSPAVDDGAITFGPDGLARDAAGLPMEAALAACITGTALPENRRTVEVLSGSRFQVATDSQPSCSAPLDP